MVASLTCAYATLSPPTYSEDMGCVPLYSLWWGSTPLGGAQFSTKLGRHCKAKSVVLQLVVVVVVQAYKEWKIISSFIPSSDSREENCPLVDVPLEKSSSSQTRSLMVNPEMYKVNMHSCPHSDDWFIVERTTKAWREDEKGAFLAGGRSSITSAVGVGKGKWCWLPPPFLQSPDHAGGHAFQPFSSSGVSSV